MTDRAQFEAMLEALINDDQDQAKEIFHNIVVGKSREIYEELLAEDFSKDTGNPYSDSDDSEDDSEADDAEDDETDDAEAGDSEADDAEDDGEADDAEDDGEESEFGDEEGEESGDMEDRVMDLEDALEDLKAEFEHLLQGEEGEEHMDAEPEMGMDADMGNDMGDEPGMDDQDMGGADELAKMMEYVNKIGVPYGSGANLAGKTELQNVGASTGGSYKASGNTRSLIDNMTNDMGGSAGNIAQNHVEVHGDAGVKAGGTKGGLADPSTKPLIGKVMNTPGGDAGKTAFKTRVKGGGIDAQGEFKATGKLAGAHSGEVGSQRGEQNTKAILKARK